MRQHPVDRRAGRGGDRVRQAQAPRLPPARRLRRRRRLPAAPGLRGSGPALGRGPAGSGHRAPRLRARRHRRDGLLLLLPHRVGPHRLRPGSGHPGGTGAGERGGLLRGLLPAHHRPRPAALRPALRALLEPRAPPDARHRHGLRLALPRRDDPLRGPALRARQGRPDRHLLDHQSPSRGARRRPGAGLPLRGGRQGGQGHAPPGHGPGHALVGLPGGAREARGGLPGGGRAAGDVRRRSRRPQGHRRGQGPGGPAPPGRHPRRRRGHHRRASHRVPARPAQARGRHRSRRRPHRHPVRDARGGGAGAAQDGLPRAAEPRRHHRHPGPHPGEPGRRGRHRHRPPRRRGDAGPAPPGRLGGGVPARGRPHARPHAQPGPHQLRRRGRPGGAVPPRADGGQHAQRLRRPQERPQAGALPPPRPGAAADRHPGPDDLPGVGHAGGPALRRLLPGGGRQPPQGVRQEDQGPDRPGTGEVRGRLRGQRLRDRAGHRPVRHHRALRRLRLQQEPLLRLRPGRLPDRLPQGPLPGGVPGCPAHLGQGRPGPFGGLPERVPAHGHRGLGARHQPVAVELRRPPGRGRALDHPLRALGCAQRG